MHAIAIEPADDDLLRAVGESLRAFNIAASGAPAASVMFVATARDTQGTLIGGITCDLYLGGMFVEWAWVADSCRGKGIGRELVAEAEAEGARRSATFAHLDTFSFQARGFYERCGYSVFGILDYPGGVQRFYMRKDLCIAPPERRT